MSMGLDVATLGMAKSAATDLVKRTVRAGAQYSPATKANGAIGSTMDTRQPVTTFESPTAPSPLTISSGLITHTPYPAVMSAGYMQADLGARVRRIGCMASWPTSALGVIALVIPSAPWSEGVLPNAGFHLVIGGNLIWTLTRFTTGGSTTIASYSTHGRPAAVWGTGLQPFDVWLDPENARATIAWPDGSTTLVQSPYLASETSNYAIWELFENNSGDVAASFGDLWADTAAPRPDSAANYPGLLSTAPAAYNVAAGLVCDWSKTMIHEVTLVGNLTSLTFTNPPNRTDIVEVTFAQDGTGSRTLAGAGTNIKWAGGATPTLTTTPGRRDTFRFRFNGTNYYEVSRSMNVG